MRLAQGRVDCLSPRPHQKSLIRLMFRGTLFESQFSSKPLSVQTVYPRGASDTCRKNGHLLACFRMMRQRGWRLGNPG